jgi:hypothetical protein
MEEARQHLAPVLRSDDPCEFGHRRDAEPPIAKRDEDLGVLADELGRDLPVERGAL